MLSTCRDKFGPERLAEVGGLIDKDIVDSACWSANHVLRNKDSQTPRLFLVDNTGLHDSEIGVTGLEHSSISELRAEIERITADPEMCLQVCEDVPVEWLAVLDRFRAKHAEGSRRVSFADAIELGRECKLGSYDGISCESEVEAMPNKFHRLGAICWRSEKTVREVVVLDPQWLIDAATTVVRDSGHHPMGADKGSRVRVAYIAGAKERGGEGYGAIRELRRDEELLRVESKLSKPLALAMWKAEGYTDKDIEAIYSMMELELFGILVPQQEDHRAMLWGAPHCGNAL